MNRYVTLSTPAVVALALAMSAGSAFASATFTTAAPGNGMSMDDFQQQVAVYNAKDINELVDAKTVTVIKYDTAWTDSKDMGKAVNILTDDAQSIGLLREGLKANPQAVKLLEDNHIAINDVVDIVSDGAGNVSVYVS